MSSIVVPINIENNLAYLLPPLSSATLPNDPSTGGDTLPPDITPPPPTPTTERPRPDPDSRHDETIEPTSTPKTPEPLPSPSPGKITPSPSPSPKNIEPGLGISNYGLLVFPIMSSLVAAVIVFVTLPHTSHIIQGVRNEFGWGQVGYMTIYLIIIYLSVWIPTSIQFAQIFHENALLILSMIPFVSQPLLWGILTHLNIHNNTVAADDNNDLHDNIHNLYARRVKRTIWVGVFSFFFTLIPVILTNWISIYQTKNQPDPTTSEKMPAVTIGVGWVCIIFMIPFVIFYFWNRMRR